MTSAWLAVVAVTVADVPVLAGVLVEGIDDALLDGAGVVMASIVTAGVVFELDMAALSVALWLTNGVAVAEAADEMLAAAGAVVAGAVVVAGAAVVALAAGCVVPPVVSVWDGVDDELGAVGDEAGAVDEELGAVDVEVGGVDDGLVDVDSVVLVWAPPLLLTVTPDPTWVVDEVAPEVFAESAAAGPVSVVDPWLPVGVELADVKAVSICVGLLLCDVPGVEPVLAADVPLDADVELEAVDESAIATPPGEVMTITPTPRAAASAPTRPMWRP